ncbi:MAG: hypothetical protein AAF492_15520 [Verrucomicrobiota bacterium]
MAIDRRVFMKTGAGAAAAAALADIFRAMPALASADATGLARHFADRGYKMVDPVDMIRPHGFNGGLLYTGLNEYHMDDPGKEPDKWFVIQGCGRLEDLDRKHEPGVLAHFHILSFRNNAPAYPGETFDLALGFLVRQAGFKPERLAFVSTDKFKPYLKLLQPYGISESQVVYRSIDEARKAGDGSGFFSPKGHPAAPGNHCVSFHYVPEGTPLPDKLGYPPEGYFEIGEFLFESEKVPTSKLEVASFGVERLAMARGKPAGDFESSRDSLVAKLEEEARRRGIDLPHAHRRYAEK